MCRFLLAGAMLIVLSAGSAGCSGKDKKDGDDGEGSLGKRVYDKHCASCHGPKGHGDGSGGGIPPPDLAKGQWRYERTAESIRRVTEKGIEPRMPATRLDSGELDAVVAYVLELAHVGLSPEATKLAEEVGLKPEDSPAPDVALRDLGGREVALKPAKSQLTLAYFWRTTSTPCVAELPKLGQLTQDYDKRGLKVLAICVDAEGAEAVRSLVPNPDKALTVGFNPDGRAKRLYAVEQSPTIALIDDRGRVLARGSGIQPSKKEKFRAFLDAALSR